MHGDFEAFYLRHVKAIYHVCYAFMKMRRTRRTARRIHSCGQ